MKKRILIATGGSGGHVIPATVFYHLLKNRFKTYISSDLRGVNYFDKKYDIKIIKTPKIFNNFILIPIKLFLMFFLTFNAVIFLKRKKIEIVLSTGGYAPIPLCLACIILTKKMYLFEPNQVLGRSNKFFLKYCDKVFCYSKKIKNFPKSLVSRIHQIHPLVRKKFYFNIKKKSKKFNLAIIGGSQGAKIFDESFSKLICEISKKRELTIVHQTQKNNIKKLKNFYRSKKIKNKVFHFNKDLMSMVKNTDLCITRAGASSLSELLILNIPFVAIPLPTSKDNHQYENAKFFQSKKCCWILDEKNLKEKYLYKFFKNIVLKKKEYLLKFSSMRKINKKYSWKKQAQMILGVFDEN